LLEFTRKFQSVNHPIFPNRSIIPKNDVKNTKLGNFHQSHGRKIWIFNKTSKSVENPKNQAALQIQSKKIQWEHKCLSVDNFGYILTFITFISYIFLFPNRIKQNTYILCLRHLMLLDGACLEAMRILVWP